MSMFYHHLIGSVILIVMWHVWVKHYFYTQEDVERAREEIDEWFK